MVVRKNIFTSYEYYTVCKSEFRERLESRNYVKYHKTTYYPFLLTIQITKMHYSNKV